MIVIPHIAPHFTPHVAPHISPVHVEARPRPAYRVVPVWHPPIFIYLPHQPPLVIPGHVESEQLGVEAAETEGPDSINGWQAFLIILGICLGGLLLLAWAAS
jgi:hypothetical protein